jgi:hypothetical protein
VVRWRNLGPNRRLNQDCFAQRVFQRMLCFGETSRDFWRFRNALHMKQQPLWQTFYGDCSTGSYTASLCGNGKAQRPRQQAYCGLLFYRQL